jgi:hypothetical protein
MRSFNALSDYSKINTKPWVVKFSGCTRSIRTFLVHHLWYITRAGRVLFPIPDDAPMATKILQFNYAPWLFAGGFRGRWMLRQSLKFVVAAPQGLNILAACL